MSLPSIHDEQNVAAIIRDKNAIFQPQGPRIPGDPRYENRPSRATPAAMKILLEELIAYTSEVQQAADHHGISKDSVQSQWQSDMAHWVARLNRYYDEIKDVDPLDANTLAGADEIYFKVTSPLLDGYFYESMPGIMLNQEEKDRIDDGEASNKKPPDLYVPFSLGNQVLVYGEHQAPRWEKFWADVLKEIEDLLAAAAGAAGAAVELIPPWVWGVGVAVGVTALALGAGYVFLSYRAMRAPFPTGNPDARPTAAQAAKCRCMTAAMNAKA